MKDRDEKIRYWSYHRQKLGKQGENLNGVLKNVIAVYSSHPTAPLSLFARTKSFNEQEFYQLDRQKKALRIPAMRLSVHMVPGETASLILAATVPPASDPVWDKRYSQKGRYIPADKYPQWQKQISDIANKPLTTKEIKDKSDVPDNIIKPVLNRMAFEGSLLRVGAESLRSNIVSYVSTKEWTGKSFDNINNDEALVWLAGEYLKIFGPVRVKDFQWWAGIAPGKAKEAINNLNTVNIGDDYLLLAENLQKFNSFDLPPKDTIDLLPHWDCYTMGYAPDGRQRFVSTDMQDKIYGSLGATGGNALGTVLINGFANGNWSFRFKGSQMNVTVNMFENPSEKVKLEIENQIRDIAELFKVKKLVIDFY